MWPKVEWDVYPIQYVALLIRERRRFLLMSGVSGTYSPKKCHHENLLAHQWQDNLFVTCLIVKKFLCISKNKRNEGRGAPHSQLT